VGGTGDDSGVLKTDKWFDGEREYISEGINAGATVERRVHKHLKRTIPEFQHRPETRGIPTERVRLLFNDDHGVLDGRDPDFRN